MEAFGFRPLAARVLPLLGLRLLLVLALRAAVLFEPRLVLALALRLEPRPLLVLAVPPARPFEVRPVLVVAFALRLALDARLGLGLALCLRLPPALPVLFAPDADLREPFAVRLREPLELRAPAPPPRVEAKLSTASFGTSTVLRAALAAFCGALASRSLPLRLTSLPICLAATGTRVAVPTPTATPPAAAIRRRESGRRTGFSRPGFSRPVPTRLIASPTAVAISARTRSLSRTWRALS